jgi:hypothetical protein
LIAWTAKLTPRLKPIVGAELGPVIAARQPILIGSESAIAGSGNDSDAAPSAPAPPKMTSRREIAMCCSRWFPVCAPVLSRDRGRPLRREAVFCERDLSRI